MKRYRLSQEEESIAIEPIDPEATESLIEEIRAILPAYSPDEVLLFMVNYAQLANMNLSHPSDHPGYQAAFDFMVRLTTLLATRPNGMELWNRWELGAKGQIEVTE